MDPKRRSFFNVLSKRYHCIQYLWDNPLYPVFMGTPEGEIIYWNEGAGRILGYDENEIIGEKARILYPSSQKSDFEADVIRLKKGEILKGQRLARHKNGSLNWIEIHSRMFYDVEGNPQIVVVTLVNLQPLKQLEEKLHENMARTEAIIKTTVEGIITIDIDGHILSFNPAAECIFGYREDDIIGKRLNTLVPSSHGGNHQNYIKQFLKTGDKHVIDRCIETTGVHKDGSRFPIELSVSEVAYYNKRLFTGIVRDISERRKLEKQLLEIGDEERMRIGIDLHDGLGQMLTGIGLICQDTANNMTRQQIPYAQQISKIADFIKEADEYARTLSHLMIPVEINNGRFNYAIETLCKRIEKISDVTCTACIEGDLSDIPKNTGIHLYHIVQEAINNAIKHGKATELKLFFNYINKELKVCIQDNGIGIPESQQRNKNNGMGIQIMRYRVRIAGGKIEFERTCEGYTFVKCVIPNTTTPPDHNINFK